MKPEVGETREAKIAAMLASGLKAPAIQAACEYEAPECIPDGDPRRKEKSAKGWPAFDATARQRMLEAIRSTRRLMRIEDDELELLVEDADGNAPMQSINKTELKNMRRRGTGEFAIDQMYGISRYIWLKDDNEKHPEKGRYKRGDYMPLWLPVDIAHRGFLLPTDKITLPKDSAWTGTFEKGTGTPDDPKLPGGFHERGIPDAFLSIWAGSTGVGKSRLAVATTKRMNLMERERSRIYKMPPRPVLYYNGEAEATQFRQWCGTDVDEELFLAHHGDMIRTERIVADCYKFKPWVVIVDSFQMLAEYNKGLAGTMRALSRFKLLKNDPAAGMPHFIFISQLNKKKELAGSQKIPHLVDFVATVTKYERAKGCFIIECPYKNRGGETGHGGLFRHTDVGIECLTTNFKTGSIFNLVQKTADPTAAGTTAPAARPAAAPVVTPVQPMRPQPVTQGILAIDDDEEGADGDEE